ncbi:hypothetical protein [Streptomyces cucumeris]|uniref:hypothetical protein n=1 Tax=Streptomyces cucumeris TaxID=2962890 RepID=UPI003D755A4D
MGPGRMPGEAVFVPSAGATREDDGELLTVEPPRRVPSGIHGSWIADAGPEAAEAGV